MISLFSTSRRCCKRLRQGTTARLALPLVVQLPFAILLCHSSYEFPGYLLVCVGQCFFLQMTLMFLAASFTPSCHDYPTGLQMCVFQKFEDFLIAATLVAYTLLRLVAQLTAELATVPQTIR